jgi:hypothetical protein
MHQRGIEFGMSIIADFTSTPVSSQIPASDYFNLNENLIASDFHYWD